jgi:hypothetical protein
LGQGWVFGGQYPGGPIFQIATEERWSSKKNPIAHGAVIA